MAQQTREIYGDLIASKFAQIQLGGTLGLSQVMRTPLQILFLILVTDLPPSIALGMEPGHPTKGIQFASVCPCIPSEGEDSLPCLHDLASHVRAVLKARPTF